MNGFMESICKALASSACTLFLNCRFAISEAAEMPVPVATQAMFARPFICAGEWDMRHPWAQTIYLVKDGLVPWRYSIPLYTAPFSIQEFSDITMMSNGNIVFASMSGAGIITPDKNLIWQFRCPPETETHSCQPVGKDLVLLALNGKVGKVLLINTVSNEILKEVVIPTTGTFAHYQFRHVRMTPGKQSFMVGLLTEKKVVELDFDGKERWSYPASSAWSAIRLKNGNTLISGDGEGYTREVNMQGETVWEFTQKDTSIKLHNTQTASRLANGNTVITNWVAGIKNVEEWKNSVQAFEVTPDKKVVWSLSSWNKPDLGPCTTFQFIEALAEGGEADLQR
jgi:hypothetical protein